MQGAGRQVAGIYYFKKMHNCAASAAAVLGYQSRYISIFIPFHATTTDANCGGWYIGRVAAMQLQLAS